MYVCMYRNIYLKREIRGGAKWRTGSSCPPSRAAIEFNCLGEYASVLPFLHLCPHLTLPHSLAPFPIPIPCRMPHSAAPSLSVGNTRTWLNVSLNRSFVPPAVGCCCLNLPLPQPQPQPHPHPHPQRLLLMMSELQSELEEWSWWCGVLTAYLC